MKSLFKWFMQPESLAKLAWFTNIYSIDDFTEVDKLLFLFLCYCSELGIAVKKSFLTAFLNTDGIQLVKQYNIKTMTMDVFNYEEPASLQEGFRIVSRECLELFDVYAEETIAEDAEFKVDVLDWMESEKKRRIQETMADNFSKLNSGDQTDNIIDGLQAKLNDIANKFDRELLTDLDDLEGRAVKDGQFVQSYVSKWGIPIVDEDTGGIYTGQCWTLAAQPGSGKTRIAVAKAAYNCAVVEKKGVLFDELELSKGQVESMFISIHIANKFQVKIPDNTLNRPSEMSQEQMRYYEAAKDDLFNSGNYGRIVIRAGRDLVVEKMRSEMRTYFKLNKDVKLWVIDYMGVLSSHPLNPRQQPLIKADIIDTGYKYAHKISQQCDVGIVCVNQFNKEGNDAAWAGKTLGTGMIEGGQSIERWSDYHMNMTFTEAQKTSGLRGLSSGKIRIGRGFFNALLQVDLAISKFEQVKRDVQERR